MTRTHQTTSVRYQHMRASLRAGLRLPQNGTFSTRDLGAHQRTPGSKSGRGSTGVLDHLQQRAQPQVARNASELHFLSFFLLYFYLCLLHVRLSGAGTTFSCLFQALPIMSRPSPSARGSGRRMLREGRRACSPESVNA